jgi:hypothetical protein
LDQTKGVAGVQHQAEELIAHGWKWDWRDGGEKYFHVDDLEKIEGPPPEGPF